MRVRSFMLIAASSMMTASAAFAATPAGVPAASGHRVESPQPGGASGTAMPQGDTDSGDHAKSGTGTWLIGALALAAVGLGVAAASGSGNSPPASP